MPIMDPKKSVEQLRISEFGGIQSNARLSPTGALDMCNFRILSDGSLEKRCRSRLLSSLTGCVRGAWEGVVDGESYCFAVAGASVYRIDENADGDAPAPIYYLPSTEGPVTFLPYADRLYLADGITMARFVPALGTFTSADGYTPLYGKNWSPSGMGGIYEPINLVQNRIRIHYLNTIGDRVFHLPFAAKSIDRLKVNGRVVTTYSFVRGETTFSISDTLAMEYGSVEVAVTLETVFDRRASVLYGGLAAVYRDPYRETMVFGGGYAGYRVYLTSPVSDEQISACSLFYENTDPLYVRDDMTFAVGSVQHPITALLQCGKQMLLFNDRTMWALRYPSSDAEAPEVLLLRTGIGCVSRGGAILCGNGVVTVQESGITRLTFKISDPDTCDSELLSIPIADRFNGAALNRTILLWRWNANELWVRDIKDPDGTIWIYSDDRKIWYTYENLSANCLFECFGSVGFGTEDGALCMMDEACYDDRNMPIHARYISNYLDGELPEIPKRVCRACVCADAYDSELRFSIDSERCFQEVNFFGNTSTGAPSLFDCRISIGRFRLLRYRLLASGPARVRIHYLSLFANN